MIVSSHLPRQRILKDQKEKWLIRNVYVRKDPMGLNLVHSFLHGGERLGILQRKIKKAALNWTCNYLSFQHTCILRTSARLLHLCSLFLKAFSTKSRSFAAVLDITSDCFILVYALAPPCLQKMRCMHGSLPKPWNEWLDRMASSDLSVAGWMTLDECAWLMACNLSETTIGDKLLRSVQGHFLREACNSEQWNHAFLHETRTKIWPNTVHQGWWVRIKDI